MTSPIGTNNAVERLIVARDTLAGHLMHNEANYVTLGIQVIQSLSDRIDVLAKLAGDVRWKELAEGSPFTVVDRMMLRDLHAAGQASLTQGGKNNG